MKVLSHPQGDGLLTNSEVHVWLKEKKFGASKRDLEPHQIRPARSTITLARDLRQYLETCPAGNQTVQSVKSLFTKLEKFKLSSPELLMIANVRPEGYAHLTPLLVDADSRFDENQLYEMLGLINDTLEKRPKPLDPGADGDEGASTEKEGVTTAAEPVTEDAAVKQATQNMANASITPEPLPVQAERATHRTSPTTTTPEPEGQSMPIAQSSRNESSLKGTANKAQVLRTEQVAQDVAPPTVGIGEQNVSTMHGTQNAAQPTSVSGTPDVRVKREAQDVAQTPAATQGQSVETNTAGIPMNESGANVTRAFDERGAAQNTKSGEDAEDSEHGRNIKQEKIEDR